jgi:O-antigen/teichoic acid export membrane protein
VTAERGASGGGGLPVGRSASPEEAPTLAIEAAAAGPLVAGSGVRGMRNSAMVLAAQLGSRLLALGSVIVIGRSLGSFAFGQMQTAVTYGAIVSVVADLGLSTLYLREGARRPDRLGRYLDNMLSVRLPLFAAAILVLIGALWVVGLHQLVVATAALLVSSGLQLVLRNSFYALQRVKFVVVETIPEALLLLGLVVLGALHHLDAAYFIWAYVISYVAAALYFAAVLMAIGVWRPRARFEMSLIRPWFLMTLPLAVSYVFTTVYWQVDVPILQHFASPRATPQCANGLAYCEVGWYQLAYKPFQALLVVPFALRTAVFPILSIYHREAPRRLAIGVEKFYKALFVIGLPAAIGVVILADQYTSLLDLYPQAAPALRLLGITVVFMFVDNANAAALLAMDRQRTYAWIVGVGMLLNIALNAVLIPVVEASHPGYGYWVTSANTVLTEVGLVVIGWFALRRLGVSVPVLRIGWRIVPAALLMGGFVVLVRPEGRIATLGITVAAAALYLVLLWLFRVADEEERTLIRRALRGA